MEGPSGPQSVMDRLSADDSCQAESCKCDKTQGKVNVKSKRYGRGAVESGKLLLTGSSKITPTL